MTIDTLPDYVLIQTFCICRDIYSSCPMWWRSLVHVCRRWRQIVFSSPRSLHLVILCNPRTPIRTSLNIWPPFLLSIHHDTSDPDEEGENTVAALELRDRVSEISIDCLKDSVLERLTATMLEPFPELSHLYLAYRDDITPVLPDAFLGGFAPSLQSLELVNVASPALSVSFLSLDSPHSDFGVLRTSHPRRWSLVSLHCPISKILALVFSHIQTIQAHLP